MCEVLKVSRSTYYAWLKRQAGPRQKRREYLYKKVKDTYFECKQRYGSPRLTVELQEQNVEVSRPTVAKIMRKLGLRSRIGKKYIPTTTDSNHNQPISPNLLERNFKVDQPGKVWVSDITYLATLEGFMYLTVILDLYDRKVVGWSLSNGLKTQETVLAAWYRAMANRPIQAGLIFHSDRGVQYASRRFRNVLNACKVTQSMSRKANCWDNAVAESFFKSLKAEAIYGNKLGSKKQLKPVIFEYIEIWYNRQRRHSYIGNKTIRELEIEDQLKFNRVA